MTATGSALVAPVPAERVLYFLQDGRCFCCNKRMKPVPHTHEKPWTAGGYTKEHVVAHRDGGRWYRNMALSHRDCNVARGDAYPSPDEQLRVAALWNMVLLMGVRIEYPRIKNTRHSGAARRRYRRQRDEADMLRVWAEEYANRQISMKMKELLDEQSGP